MFGFWEIEDDSSMKLELARVNGFSIGEDEVQAKSLLTDSYDCEEKHLNVAHEKPITLNEEIRKEEEKDETNQTLNPPKIDKSIKEEKISEIDIQSTFMKQMEDCPMKNKIHINTILSQSTTLLECIIFLELDEDDELASGMLDTPPDKILKAMELSSALNLSISQSKFLIVPKDNPSGLNKECKVNSTEEKFTGDSNKMNTKSYKFMISISFLWHHKDTSNESIAKKIPKFIFNQITDTFTKISRFIRSKAILDEYDDEEECSLSSGFISQLTH
ncbi:unnamed protein product [Moneuplotes crassus]|uniref:Uncharacterized protein n=1 Tax=Euplotes crassus TaxID=5936 RepID=A0AAD1YA33_EUPCR|nr:unnamed protein product [Moneuplotes crassus]